MSSTRSKRLLKEFKMVRNEEDFVEMVDHTSSDIGKWQVKVQFVCLCYLNSLLLGCSEKWHNARLLGYSHPPH